jgi:hypothetical protein
MSKFEGTATNMTEAEHLCAALEAVGYSPTQHETPVHLYGFTGDKRPEVAHIVVPRNQIGGVSNDIGFFKEADGTYRAIISKFDRFRHGQTWLGKLTQAYKEKQAMADGIKQGYCFTGKEILPTGKVRLKFEVRQQRPVFARR